MAKTLSKTLTHGDFASVFQEVQQPESVSWTIVGDLGYAIDGAFEKICRIEQHEVQEIHMANQLIFERMTTQYRSDYLTIPADTEKKFFSEQKIAYDHLTDPCFSYSGPTPMGKSFIMRMFIKDEIVLSGSSVIPQRVNAEGKSLQSDESYVMMRKFGLILLRDIMEDRDSLVRREFSDLLSVADENDIRAKFSNSPILPDDDINTSVDQTKSLIKAIRDGLEYPPCVNGGFRYADVIEFLNKLSAIFEWDTYEKTTLGKEPLRRWYAVILCQWMEGTGLSFIMKKAIEYRRNHPDNFYISAYQPPTTYNDRSKEHRNIVFAETLEVIENVILFSISNYFLRFSNEYKKIHNVAEFDNNWYEYVEFGTTNPLTILLQRNGFSREAATFIREHREFVEEDGSTGRLRLKNELLTCGNTSVEMEAADIKYNAPGLFAEDRNASEDLQLSLIRTIECPDCGVEFEVDLEEYLQDVSCFENENGMGHDAVYSFDSDSNCECPYCGKIIHVTGWIREYPTGVLDSEDIIVDLWEDDGQ